jgi:hypothetical protein
MESIQKPMNLVLKNKIESLAVDGTSRPDILSGEGRVFVLKNKIDLPTPDDCNRPDNLSGWSREFVLKNKHTTLSTISTQEPMIEDYLEPSCSVEEYQAPTATVRVLVVEGCTSPVGAANVNPLERKRATIWTNTHRNLQIARIAKAVSGQELDALWNEGLFLNETEYPAIANGRLSVLAESPEHGEILSNLLWRWPFLHAVPESLPDREAFFDLDAFDNTIYTLVAAEELNLFDPQVLIIAGGGDWAPDISGYPPADPTREMLVIDFADDFDEQAEKATRNRLCQYRERGWQVEAAQRLQSWPMSVGGKKMRRRTYNAPTPAEEAQEYLDQLNS